MSDFNPLDYPLAFANVQYLAGNTAWAGHLPFAMAVVQMTRPGTFAELGAHWGNSYFAFCQATAMLGLDTRCIAVDTWKGDVHTGEYKEEVYDHVKAHNDRYFAGRSRLVRDTFDNAAAQVPDNVFDLLHIDGLHTYEAVKHDFETWKPKLSSRGVVLFHDIAEKSGDFGVWKMWDELKVQYPSFAFEHEHGLGVLAVGSEAPPDLLKFLAAANKEPKLIRDFFNALGAQWMRADLEMRAVRILERSHLILEQWQTATGRALTPPGPEEWLLGIARAVHADVREIVQAKLPANAP